MGYPEPIECEDARSLYKQAKFFYDQYEKQKAILILFQMRSEEMFLDRIFPVVLRIEYRLFTENVWGVGWRKGEGGYTYASSTLKDAIEKAYKEWLKQRKKKEARP